MNTALAKFEIPPDIIWCSKCNRQVEYFEWKTPLAIVDDYPYPCKAYTGEIIVTIRCHGEAWMASNWSGRLA